MRHFKTLSGPLGVASLLLSGSLYGCVAAQEIPAENAALVPDGGNSQKAAPGLYEVTAKPVTFDTIKTLPAAEQPAWRTYLERSQAAARADQAALDAEVAASGTGHALQAPGGADFKLPAKTGDVWYAGEEASRLAGVILSYQTASGGWSKHTGYSEGPRKPGMQWTSQNTPGQPPHYVATFDNRSTTEQLHFLANIWQATRREDCKAAFLKGLDFILKAQFPNGGWPQVYPLEGSYHDGITFNDDAMMHIIELLRAITNNQPQFAFVDEPRRVKAQEAAAAGLRCILRAQIIQNGKRTAWCAQHDPLTLAPAPARKFEPASLSGGESVNVVRFLMSIEPPGDEIKAAIEGAISWFQESKITGIDVLTKKNQVGGTVFFVVTNTAAPPVWARFYELGTNRPIFVDRDTGVHYSLAELDQQGPGKGYNWYVRHPAALLETDYPKWRAKWGQN